MIKKVIMKNLICSNCAGKIEKALGELDYINSASFNFPNQVMLLDTTEDYDNETAIIQIKKIVDSIEEGVDTFMYEDRHIVKTKENVEKYSIFFIGLAIFLIGYLFERFEIKYVNLPFYWISYLLIVEKILKKTIKGIRRKEVFNENTLMFIATMAAMFLGDYLEAVSVIILYTLGEHLQHRAVNKSKREVSGLMDLHIEYANVRRDNKVIITDPHSIKKGETVIVKNGEKIPVDGIIIKGSTSLNTSALTGEAKLQMVKIGTYVLSGNINVGNVIEMEVSKEYNESTIAKVIDLIENSTFHKAKTENFITKFAKVYTPLVTLLAILMVVIPSLINPDLLEDYVYRAATFLVISCPCALVLSIPLSYFAGIGKAAKNGILFKGSTFLDMMNNVTHMGIDKTGTLTHGNFIVTEYTDEETLKIAASLERFSNHPIAKSIVSNYDKEFYEYENVEEIAGFGIKVETKDGIILAGNRKLLKRYNVRFKEKKVMVGSNVFVSVNGKYIGKVIVKDQIKDSSRNVIRRLSRKYDITMLTGDNDLIAKDVSESLGGIHFHSNLLPTDKVKVFNEIEAKGFKMYIGDGINDAPLLNSADIGVAMGGGSDIALDVADVIIMNDDLKSLEKAFRIAKKTKIIVIENIALSLGIKFGFLVLAAFGSTMMWQAIFADVGITIIAVLNSLRIIYSKKGIE
ncbi:heavy metal translocating P-type ATPase [Candidatus Izimaplasma bacterium ZiA1]|uniref:heavy metal translocating P-type ATPase n=1 Tax=Candidatus Izimoplasma sp. ZiA1 TaxID=2024899 RepID=UPI00143C5412